MPGAGGTGQPQQQQTDLYDMLAGEIAKVLGAEQPQAPQPAQHQPLSPTSAFAAARNPQFAPMLNQAAQAPEQSRFASQQAAFEAAMSGRERAMQTGASLVGSQMRMAGQGGRPALGTIEMDVPDGKGGTMKQRTLVNVIRDPDGTARIQTLGPAPWAPGEIPGVPGVSAPMTYSRTSSQPGAATPIANAPIPPAPASVEEDYRKNQAFIDGSNHLRESFRKLKQATAGRGPVAGAIGQELGEFKYGGAIPFSADNAAFENELRTTLDTMIVAITGLSFPEQAFKRYRSELPVATDSEDQAMQKIDNVVRKFIAEQKSIKGAYPAAGRGQEAAGQYSGMTLHEADFANANPGERERFIAGGGQVVP